MPSNRRDIPREDRINAILDGSIKDTEFARDPVFGFDVPTALPGVDSTILQPREAWADKASYDETLARLARMYRINFEQYDGVGATDYTAFGPQVSMTEAERADVARLVAAEK